MSVRVQNEMFKTLNQKMFSGNVPIKRVYAGDKLVYPVKEDDSGLLKTRRLELTLCTEYETNVFRYAASGNLEIYPSECNGKRYVHVDVTFFVDVYIEEVPIYDTVTSVILSNANAAVFYYTPHNANGYMLRVFPVDGSINDSIPGVGIIEVVNDYHEWPQYRNGERYGPYSTDHSEYYSYKNGFWDLKLDDPKISNTEKQARSTFLDEYAKRYGEEYFVTSVGDNHQCSIPNGLAYRITTSYTGVNKERGPLDYLLFDSHLKDNNGLFFAGSIVADNTELPKPNIAMYENHPWILMDFEGENPGDESLGDARSYSWQEQSTTTVDYKLLKPQLFPI